MRTYSKILCIAILLGITIVTSNLCFSQATPTIMAKQNDNPVPSTGVCEGTPKITLSLTNVPPDSKFSWTGPNQFTSTFQNPDVETNLASSGMYTVNVTNTTTTNSITSTISIVINPKPSKIKTYFNIAGKVVTLIALSDEPNYSYSWKSPQGMTSTSKIFENNNTSINELGIYKLVVKGNNNCTTELTTDITKNKEEIVKTEPFGINTEEEDNASFDYYFLKDCPMYQCDILGNLISNEEIPIPWSNARFSPKFTLLSESGDFVIIKFWKWGSKTNYYSRYNKNSSGEPLFFKVSKKDLLSSTRKHFNIWLGKGAAHISAGTVIIPVKLRFNEFDFSKDITLGPFVGLRTRMHQTESSFVSLGFSVGITSVSLNPANTKKDGVAIKENVDVAAFTWALGTVFEFQRVQIGIFWGHDNISKASGYEWNYQNRGWLSVGFGYSILSSSSNSKQSSGGDN